MVPARVLVVDDEPDLEPLIRQKFRHRIRDGEIEFVFARHGEEALQKLRDHPDIDVVLTDINMPVMDGLTLLLHLGEFSRLVKTVIVSAYDDMQNIRTAMNRGAFDFLTKPINFEDFDVTLRKTLQELALIRQATEHREQLFALRSELAVARRIQQAILPAVFPESPHFEVYAEMLPARVVSGDFFDFFLLDDGRLGFVVADVSGKGIPAALYMAVSHTLLRSTIAQKLLPQECMLYINRVLMGHSESEMYVTLLYGILDGATGELEFFVAGHTPPWLISPDGQAQALTETRGTMLGLFDDPEIGAGRVTLFPGSLFLVTTDGVIDAERPDGAEFSSSRVRHAIETEGGSTPRDLVSSVFQALTAFSAGAPQSDDITALAVRFLGSSTS